MYRAGIRSILSELLRQNRLVASEDIMPSTPKTKELVAKLKDLSKSRVLIIADELTENIYLSSRNVANLEVKYLRLPPTDSGVAIQIIWNEFRHDTSFYSASDQMISAERQMSHHHLSKVDFVLYQILRDLLLFDSMVFYHRHLSKVQFLALKVVMSY
jgi:hypothetical protein